MKNSISNFREFALSRTDMKSISGGCAVYLPSGWKPASSFSWSASTYTKNSDGSVVITGLDNSTVDKFMASGGNWCCQSCSKASWL